MRKSIWTALVALLFIAGGLVFAHSGEGETSASTPEEAICPHQAWRPCDHIGHVPHCLMNHASHSAGDRTACPLQRLLSHLSL